MNDGKLSLRRDRVQELFVLAPAKMGLNFFFLVARIRSMSPLVASFGSFTQHSCAASRLLATVDVLSSTLSPRVVSQSRGRERQRE